MPLGWQLVLRAECTLEAPLTSAGSNNDRQDGIYLRVDGVDDHDAEVSVQERDIQTPNGVANLFRFHSMTSSFARVREDEISTRTDRCRSTERGVRVRCQHQIQSASAPGDSETNTHGTLPHRISMIVRAPLRSTQAPRRLAYNRKYLSTTSATAPALRRNPVDTTSGAARTKSCPPRAHACVPSGRHHSRMAPGVATCCPTCPPPAGRRCSPEITGPARQSR